MAAVLPVLVARVEVADRRQQVVMRREVVVVLV
jgi:hypothetical protein